MKENLEGNFENIIKKNLRNIKNPLNIAKRPVCLECSMNSELNQDI